jgi:hypothetical protein
MSAVNSKAVLEREAKLKDELRRCEGLLVVLEKLSGANQTSMISQRYESYVGFVAKTGLDQGQKEDFITKAKRFAFSSHVAKLNELIDKAIDAARARDQMKKLTMLKLAEACLAATRKLTDDGDFLLEMEKRIEVARETTHAGVSERAKLQMTSDGRDAKAVARERRRFVRYGTPEVSVRFAKDGVVYTSRDYSLIGIRLPNGPPGLQPMQKVAIWATLQRDDGPKTFQGSAKIAWVVEGGGGVGLEFPSADGPIMYFVKQAGLDLREFEPV